MFGIEKLFKSKGPEGEKGNKSYFDSEVGDYALWNNKYDNKSVISKISYGELINLYTGWLYACVNLRANSIASLQPSLHPSKFKTDTVLEDPIMDIIDWELSKAISASLDIFGSCYVLKDQIGVKTTGLQILRTDSVNTKQTEEGLITGYSFHSGKRTYHFQPDEVIAIHTYNPSQSYPNVTNGVSPAMAIAKQQLMDVMAIEYNYLFFKEGGKPGTILQTDKSIDNDEKTRIVSKWNNFFAGLKNSHKTAILDKGLSYQSTTVGQKDMELSKQREFTREEVLAMFGVGLPLLGKSDSVGFADRQVPEYYFQKYHLLPLARQIENAFNKQLFLKKGYFTYGPIVSADLKMLGELYDKGAISVNELREAHNFNPVKGGDINLDGKDLLLDTPEKKSLFSKKDMQVLLKGSKAVKKKFKEEVAEKLWVAMSKRADQYEVEMKKEISSIWDDQEEIIISNIKNSKSIKAFLKKSEEDDNNIFSGLVVGVMWIAGKMGGILKKVIVKEGKEGYILTGVNGSFDPDKLDPWIKTNVRKFGKQIDKTTKETILKRVTAGYEGGLSEREIIKEIQTEFKTFKKDRLQQIVRTESTKAVNRANMEAFSQAGVTLKEWYTNFDARTCPHCADMHGKIIGTGDNFYSKGDVTDTGLKLQYDSIAHPPLHVLCRCLLFPVI